MLREGRDAVQAVLSARSEGRALDPDSTAARFKSLALYSESQLRSGLEAYETALGDDRWQMGYVDGELQFTGKGVWSVKEGVARWQQG
jgi:hypothetical protein